MISGLRGLLPSLGIVVFVGSMSLNNPSDLRAEESKPNVLMIAIDDLNDWVSCLGGHPQANTPNIDRLAERGVLFTNAHCQAPICNPSRTSLMLGLRPSSTGVYLNNAWFRNSPRNQNRVTLGEHFGLNGYKTLSAGKIFHTSRKDSKSFQIVGPKPGQRLKKDDTLVEAVKTRSRLWDYGAQLYREEDFGDAVVASWGCDRLSETHEKPFFMAVGFYRPHVPLYAPKRFFQTRPLRSVLLPEVLLGDRKDLPQGAIELTANSTPPPHSWFVEQNEWRPAVRAYLASVSFADFQVGRLLDALDASPHAENTIVVMFSDHGFHLGEKERWAKQSLWERSTRVPFIISVPDGVKGGRSAQPCGAVESLPDLDRFVWVKSRCGNRRRVIEALA